MRDAYDVILAPVITEKTTNQMEAASVYTFIVNRGSNKIEIGQAIEKIWDVKVSDVRTMRYAGKQKNAFMGRMSRSAKVGRRAGFKKAIVQLVEGDHIEFYEAG